MKLAIIISLITMSAQASEQYTAYGADSDAICIQFAIQSAQRMAMESANKRCQSLGMQPEVVNYQILSDFGVGCWSSTGPAGAAVELTYTCKTNY